MAFVIGPDEPRRRSSDGERGAVKPMRTAAHPREGAARGMLQHIVGEARRRGDRRLRPEAGPAAAFEPAHRLYAAAGFVPCGPFSGYVDGPSSRFMTLVL